MRCVVKAVVGRRKNVAIVYAHLEAAPLLNKRKVSKITTRK